MGQDTHHIPKGTTTFLADGRYKIDHRNGIGNPDTVVCTYARLVNSRENCPIKEKV